MDSRYKQTIVNSKGIRYTKNVIYPIIEPHKDDIIISIDNWERLDNIASDFYDGDSSLYWIIAAANPNRVKYDSLYVEGGVQLRIPQNINRIKSEFNKINNF